MRVPHVILLSRNVGLSQESRAQKPSGFTLSSLPEGDAICCLLSSNPNPVHRHTDTPAGMIALSPRNMKGLLFQSTSVAFVHQVVQQLTVVQRLKVCWDSFPTRSIRPENAHQSGV